MKANFYISEKSEFESVWSLITSTFNVKETLPEKAFKKNFHRFFSEEFDWAMSADFCDTFLRPMAKLCSDEKIFVATLDPDPDLYFYNEFGYYNIFALPAKATGDEYWDALDTCPDDRPADAMLFNSEIVVWVASSKKWAVWGSRQSERCILALADDKLYDRVLAIAKTWSPVGIQKTCKKK